MGQEGFQATQKIKESVSQANGESSRQTWLLEKSHISQGWACTSSSSGLSDWLRSAQRKYSLDANSVVNKRWDSRAISQLCSLRSRRFEQCIFMVTRVHRLCLMDILPHAGLRSSSSMVSMTFLSEAKRKRQIREMSYNRTTLILILSLLFYPFCVLLTLSWFTWWQGEPSVHDASVKGICERMVRKDWV